MPLVRRHFVRATACAFAAPVLCGAGARAAPAAAPTPARPLRFLQCLDPDPGQQEHVRDFAAGLQLALKSARRQPGPPVQVVTMDCDGSATAVAAVGRRLAGDDGLLALVGTTTERASEACLRRLPAAIGPIAHVAPWLPDPSLDHLGHVANVFASREELLRQSMAALAAMGLNRMGIVYESARTRDELQPGVSRALDGVKMRAPTWTPAAGSDIEALVAALPTDAPPVLAFAGGAIELARFLRALTQRSASRLVLSLTGADQGLLQQLGATRGQALLLPQVVPNPARAALPLVRQFRDAHARLLDDAPTASTLAGYVAGRYTLSLVEGSTVPVTRASLLDEVQRRHRVDLDGYELVFGSGRNRGSHFVTLTMLTREGRLIG